MDYNKLFQSKTFKTVLWGIAGLIVFLFVFRIGMIVGYKKASFSYRWGENYHQNFAGPKSGFFSDFSGNDFIEAHGVFGQILEIDGSTLVIEGRNDTEKIVLIEENTVIRRFQDTVKLTDVKVGDNVVVIGEPNESGQIEAKLIRIMPAQPTRAPFNSLLPPPPRR